MTDIVPYEPPFTLEITLDDATPYVVEFTGDAPRKDASFLGVWLHGKSAKTAEAYTQDITRFYATIHKSLKETTLEDLQAFDKSLAHLKPRSRARTLAAIKSALTFGMDAGYLAFNVGRALKLPKIENTLAERILTDRQVYRMLDGEKNTRNHAILTLLYYGGLRAAELCNLQWRHLQERGETGQVAVYGKGKKTRFILLDEDTWREVMNLKTSLDTPGDYVFRSRQERSRTNKKGDNHRMDESMIHRIVHEAARRAGIDDNVSPHWMRHANASHSLDRGATLAMVQENLGHESINTTARYTHVRPGASTANLLRGKKA